MARIRPSFAQGGVMLALGMPMRTRVAEELSFPLRRLALPIHCSPFVANTSRRFYSALPARTEQVFAIPTYQSVFTRVLRCDQVRLALLRAFIPTLDIQYSRFIGTHLSDQLSCPSLLWNPFLNDKETLRTFKALSSSDDWGIKTPACEASPPTVNRAATVVFKTIVKNFEERRSDILERQFGAKGFCFTCELGTGEQILVNLQLFPAMFSDSRALIHLSNFLSKYVLLTGTRAPIQRLVGVYILGGEGDTRASSHSPLQHVPLRHTKIHDQVRGGRSSVAHGIDLIQYSVTAAPAAFDREQSEWLTFFTRAQCMTEADVARSIHTEAVLQAFESVKFSNLPHYVLSSYKAECEECDATPQNAAG
jgi:hypothetical protein